MVYQANLTFQLPILSNKHKFENGYDSMSHLVF